MKIKMNKENIINILKNGGDEFHQIMFDGQTVNVCFIKFDVADLKNGRVFLPLTIRQVVRNELCKDPYGTMGMSYEMTGVDLEGPSYAIAYEKDLPNKLGVIGHELGHIFLKHFDIKCRSDINGIRMIPMEDERAADKFALDHFGEGPNVIETAKMHIEKCAAVFGLGPIRTAIAKFIMTSGLKMSGRTL